MSYVPRMKAHIYIWMLHSFAPQASLELANPLWSREVHIYLQQCLATMIDQMAGTNITMMATILLASI